MSILSKLQFFWFVYIAIQKLAFSAKSQTVLGTSSETEPFSLVQFFFPKKKKFKTSYNFFVIY